MNYRNKINYITIFLFAVISISCTFRREPIQDDVKEVHGKKINVNGVEIEHLENKYTDWMSHGHPVNGGKLIGAKYRIKNTTNKILDVDIETDIKTTNNSNIFSHSLRGFKKEFSDDAPNNSIPSGVAPNGEITVWQFFRISASEADLPVKSLIASITVRNPLKNGSDSTTAKLIGIE